MKRGVTRAVLVAGLTLGAVGFGACKSANQQSGTGGSGNPSEQQAVPGSTTGSGNFGTGGKDTFGIDLGADAGIGGTGYGSDAGVGGSGSLESDAGLGGSGFGADAGMGGSGSESGGGR